MVFLPLVVAAAGVAGYVLMNDDKKVKASGAARPQVPPILDQIGQPRKAVEILRAQGPVAPEVIKAVITEVPMPAPKLIAHTESGNPIVSITPTNPETGKPTVAYNIATSGAAVPDAQRLYDYLKANPITKAAQNAQLTSLVQAFQRAHNSDFDTHKLGGKLTPTGLYDLPTSAALTLYTGMAIASHPSTPAAAVQSGLGGTINPAALTSSNLYAYLKTHKNDKKDKELSALVKAFQKAVNTDPLFPGPALAVNGKKYPNLAIIKKPLKEDGLFGPGTADALAVITFERINHLR